VALRRRRWRERKLELRNSFVAAACGAGCAGVHFVGGSPGVVEGVAGGVDDDAAAAGFGAGAGAGAAVDVVGAFTAAAGGAAGGFGGAAAGAVAAGFATGVAVAAGAAAAGLAAAGLAAGAAAAGAGFRNGIRPACQSMCANIALKIPAIIRAIRSSMMPSMPLVMRPLVMSQTIPQRQIRIAAVQRAPISMRCALDVMYTPPAVAAAVIGRLCPESSSRGAAEYARRWRASATWRERWCERGWPSRRPGAEAIPG